MGVTGAVHEVRRWRRYATEMARGLGVHTRRRDESPASLGRRVAEQWRLLLANRITAQDYYLYGLQRRDLPWARKREFVGEMDRRSWQERLNPGFYEFFSKDKVVTKRYLAQAGAPVPRLLAVIGPAGRAETGEPLRTPGGARALAGGHQGRARRPEAGSRRARGRRSGPGRAHGRRPRVGAGPGRPHRSRRGPGAPPELRA